MQCIGKGGKRVEYPKEVMSLSELKHIGYPADLLYRAAHARGSGAFKSGSGGKTTPWYFRVQDFDKWLNKQHESQR